MTSALVMIDATEGYTEQDAKVAGLAHNAGKACIIAVTKWDAVDMTVGRWTKCEMSWRSSSPLCPTLR